MNKYICMECYEIYDEDLINKEYELCPKSNCRGIIAEVDELMIPTVIELNKKGYITKYCCSGHYYDDGSPNAYIMFEDFDEIEFSDLPKGFNLEDGKIIRSHNITSEMTEEEQFCLICNNAQVLLQWAKELPMLDY